MWEIKEEYPFIFKVLQHAGRKGPKENSITILATHAFEDIEDVASLSKTGNVIFVGKQLGDFSKIVAHAKLSENGADSYRSHQDCAGKVLAVRDGHWHRTRSGRRIRATRTQSLDALDANDQCRRKERSKPRFRLSPRLVRDASSRLAS